MKILAICQYYYPENMVFTNICEELVKLGNDVTVLTGKPNYGYGEIVPEYKKIKFEEINGVKVHRVNLIARKKSRLSIILHYISLEANFGAYFAARRIASTMLSSLAMFFPAISNAVP